MTTKIILAVAALVIAGAGAADAAGKHKRKWVRHHAPAAYMPASPYAIPGPRPIWAAPGQCFTDEGYGRYWPCGAGPATR